mmetsp:Transcript_20224/g.49106  ORF Transcript_20224/g.49106 Transcript_20224/m.49106 type:complete len:85 (-) Transcript_20224:382-636(-)
MKPSYLTHLTPWVCFCGVHTQIVGWSVVLWSECLDSRVASWVTSRLHLGYVRSIDSSGVTAADHQDTGFCSRAPALSMDRTGEE